MHRATVGSRGAVGIALDADAVRRAVAESGRARCSTLRCSAAPGAIIRAVTALLAAMLTPACNDELVEDVPTTVCASGKRWVGDFTPSEEMYPGQDCVGCHLSLDGPPLMAAGTVYGLPDRGGARTSVPLCFGVEGVLVTITGWEGTVLQTRTNRAGNFFFEGDPDELPVPFSVQLDYTLPNGRVTTQTMTTQPSYGGCGRCHDPAVAEGIATPGLEPGGIAGPREIINPEFPIFTGPVHQ